MATYKVTIPVTVIVDINDDNLAADHHPVLHGDSSIVAVRRAINYLLSGPVTLKKQLGIRRLYMDGQWEDVAVEPTTLEGSETVLTERVPATIAE